MKNRKALGFLAAGLAAGLVVGSIGIAAAASSASTTTSSTTTTQSASPAVPGPRSDSDRVGPNGFKRGFGGEGDIAEAIANLTGLSVSEVEAKRAAGTSYAAIAKAEGVSTDQVIAETVKIEKEECATGVKDGTLGMLNSRICGSAALLASAAPPSA